MGRGAEGAFRPHAANGIRTYFTTPVAIAGTTISPYLFFWQAAQEAEEVYTTPERQPLISVLWQAPGRLSRIRADTAVGMAFPNLIAIAIIMMTAATLHANGVTNIQSSERPRRRCSRSPAPFRLSDLHRRHHRHGSARRFWCAWLAWRAHGVAEAGGWPLGLTRLRAA